jgi:iron complex outermembrane receptor protein
LLAASIMPTAAGLAQTAGSAERVAELKQLSLAQLMDVEVTSVSRRAEKLSDAPSAIQVITSEEIVRSGATSLPEALRLANNLDVAQRNPHDWNVSARGFNTDLTNKMLVLIDGRTVYTPLFSGVFWDVQDTLLEDIDRIEVISGPGGTLWGANAVNGVINVTTKSPKDTPGFFAEAGTGNELQALGSVRYGGVVAPGIYYRVYGKYADRDSSILSNGQEPANGWHIARGGFRVDDENFTDSRFTVQGGGYGGREDLAAGGTSEVDGWHLLTRWSQHRSPDSGFEVQAYYDYTHLASPKPANPFKPAGVLSDDLRTYDFDFHHDLRVNATHQLVWGAGFRYMRDAFQNAPTVELIPSRQDQKLLSAFAQDEMQLPGRFTLTVGTKEEHNDYTGFEIEPNVRLRRPIAERQMVWAAISRAVRTPSRVDRDLLQPTGLAAPAPSSILTGNPNFVSEAVVAYEAGYRAQPTSNVSVSASFFYNDYTHVRSITPGKPGAPTFSLPLVLANNVAGETHGFELNVEAAVTDWWRLSGGFNLLREHLHVQPGAVDFTNALNETADPHHQFTLHSLIDLPRGFQFDSSFRWVDARHTSNGPTPGAVPAYSELDVRLGWRVSSALELSIVGQNLLHAHHPEYGFPAPTDEEVQRSVFVKADWRF